MPLRSGPRVYFNEWEPYATNWLRRLWPGADVDGRSVAEVEPLRLASARRVHLFAGIGGWEYALQLAGWPDSVEVWTGSCPCQPYSTAGKGRGNDDERDLWPEMFRLVRERRPQFVFGEQVEDAIAFGWYDRLCADMEAEGYAVGAHVLGAHSAGAGHIRERLYFVAYLVGNGVPGLFKGAYPRRRQQGWPRGPAYLHDVFAAPFVRGHSYPQPLLRQMDDGVSTRVGRLRAYGNAIVPQTAAMFITAFMECWESLHAKD